MEKPEETIIRVQCPTCGAFWFAHSWEQPKDFDCGRAQCRKCARRAGKVR